MLRLLAATCAVWAPLARGLVLSPPARRRACGASTRLHVVKPEETAKTADSARAHADEAELLSFEEELVQSWRRDWDEANATTRTGFDWEMEKLRRQLDTVPEGMGGPSFWKKYILDKPESTYGGYAGSTYPGSKPGGIDSFRILLNNLLQFLLGNESEDGAVVASWDWRAALRENGVKGFAKALVTGDLQSLVGGPLFLLLTKYHVELGPVFKLAFGPRSFIVVADPAIARHVLKDASVQFDKGILAEILGPILGNGLIPADPDVWKRRRRIITPGFHKAWLRKMLTLFDECTDELVADLRLRESASLGAELPSNLDQWQAWKKGAPGAAECGAVDMEERFCSVSLDIIGRAVFDYDFGSSRRESPLVRAVYRCLVEAEKRTTAFIPYWQIPGSQFLPSQRAFNGDLKLLNDKLDELVINAFREQASASSRAEETSLLRFLVQIRGEDSSTTQLRDDLMTMLVAGHETTAALLTWTLYELYHPSGRAASHLARLREEVDANFEKRQAEGRSSSSYEDVCECAFARLCLAEGLRLYPQPPLLIRRALDEVELPRPSPAYPAVKLARGSDLFLSTWSLHKSPALWDLPEVFDPSRFERPKVPGPDAPAGWAGFDPARIPPGSLIPTEQSADYAYMPFGGGPRRCIGDQFAMLEATVMLTRLVRDFDFSFAVQGVPPPKVGLGGLPVADVGMRTGATIHTEHGLWMRATSRIKPDE